MANLYRYQKKWRQRYPEKRQRSTRRYYAKHREHPENQTRTGRPWSKMEVLLITARARPTDPVLARQLGRSVQAIQVKRNRTLSARA